MIEVYFGATFLSLSSRKRVGIVSRLELSDCFREVVAIGIRENQRQIVVAIRLIYRLLRLFK